VSSIISSFERRRGHQKQLDHASSFSIEMVGGPIGPLSEVLLLANLGLRELAAFAADNHRDARRKPAHERAKNPLQLQLKEFMIDFQLGRAVGRI
jgi:hypothetical protein